MKNVLLSSLFCCLVIGQIRADDGGVADAFTRGVVWATAGFLGSGLGIYMDVAGDFNFTENAQNGGYRTGALLATTYLTGVAVTYLIKRHTGMNDRASTLGLCLGASVIPAFVGYSLWQDRPSNRQNVRIQQRRDYALRDSVRMFAEKNIPVQEAMRRGEWRDGIGRIAAYWTLLTPRQREQYVTNDTVRLNIELFLALYNRELAGLTHEQISRTHPGWSFDVRSYRYVLQDTGLLDQPND
jgi:hypothetical protein